MNIPNLSAWAVKHPAVVLYLILAAGAAGERVGPKVVEVRRLLELLLDLVGHLPLDLVARRPGPVGRDDHRLYGERRVLGPAHVEVGVQARRPGREH